MLMVMILLTERRSLANYGLRGVHDLVLLAVLEPGHGEPVGTVGWRAACWAWWRC